MYIHYIHSISCVYMYTLHKCICIYTYSHMCIHACVYARVTVEKHVCIHLQCSQPNRLSISDMAVSQSPTELIVQHVFSNINMAVCMYVHNSFIHVHRHILHVYTYMCMHTCLYIYVICVYNTV